MNNIVNPKLSVLLVTYNHEKYIRQALDSVLMQEADFDFEIVVADDHSTDSTLAIIGKYRADNKNIRVLPSEHNVGITRNYQRGFAACRGEYIAVLEGDDFWISPNKVKSLAEFLDQHPDCALCFHRFLRHDEGTDRFTAYPTVETTTDYTLTASQLASGNFIGNFSTCMYRRAIIERLDPSLFALKVYDWMFNITVAQEGMIGYLPEIMSVYRAHSASTWSSRTEDEHRPELLELIDDYNKYLNFKFDSEFQACKFALREGMALPMGGPLKPRVSVLLVTYNHEKFIRQALDGVLMQKTSSPFEVIVADDCSSDSTLSVIEKYQASNPNIRILPANEKIGITRNYRRGFEACRGEYIAILEGDDYWISQNKLQVVSMFLDQHPLCSFCFHRTIRHDEISNQAAAYPTFAPEEESNVFTARQLATGNFVGGFSTCVYRTETITDLGPKIWKMKFREWMFNIAVAEKGSIGYTPEIMSIYRVHPGGIWSLKPPDEKSAELVELIDSYNEFLDFRFDTEFQAFKQALLLETRARRFAEATARRWIEFVPPVVLRLAKKMYLRRRSPA
jgi:glycosyltransferase involved in cell wall biosynthesis